MDAVAARSASPVSLGSGQALLGMAVNATTCSCMEGDLRLSWSQRRTISVGERWSPSLSRRLSNEFNRGISLGGVDPGRIDFERRWRVGRAVGEGSDAPLKLGEFEQPSGVTRDSEA